MCQLYHPYHRPRRAGQGGVLPGRTCGNGGRGVEAERWQRRDLTAKRYVYFWVDGIYFSARMEEEKQCILVIVGATDKGQKELIAIADGYRESEQSWLEVLLDLKRRGLEMGPQLALGDGALGFWKALRQVYPGAREQRCWVHSTHPARTAVSLLLARDVGQHRGT